MQLCIEMVDASGACDYGYACVYADTISWASPTQPLPMILDPRMVFENLFGEGGTPEERGVAAEGDRSILDWISRDVARLQKNLGPARPQPAERLSGRRARDRAAHPEESRSTTRAARRARCRRRRWACPDRYEEHVKLMFDLQALAFMTDITRVSAFKMSRDVSDRVCPGERREDAVPYLLASRRSAGAASQNSPR